MGEVIDDPYNKGQSNADEAGKANQDHDRSSGMQAKTWITIGLGRTAYDMREFTRRSS
jgi:hypothetical protein